MSARGLIALAAAGSLALLLGAYAFEAAGYAPCAMCLWQRWPHAVAIVAGAVALVLGWRVAAAIGALAALTTAALGAFHVGVEQDWWEGPASCTAGSVSGLSPDELMNRIMSAPLVRCDEIAWQFLGVSMAGWNAILSLGLAVIWLVALVRMSRG